MRTWFALVALLCLLSPGTRAADITTVDDAARAWSTMEASLLDIPGCVFCLDAALSPKTLSAGRVTAIEDIAGGLVFTSATGPLYSDANGGVLVFNYNTNETLECDTGFTALNGTSGLTVLTAHRVMSSWFQNILNLQYYYGSQSSISCVIGHGTKEYKVAIRRGNIDTPAWAGAPELRTNVFDVYTATADYATDTAALYLNAVAATNVVIPGISGAPRDSVAVNCITVGGSNAELPLSGELTVVAVWNRVLSPDEIKLATDILQERMTR